MLGKAAALGVLYAGLLASVPARCEVSISGVKWQVAAQSQGKKEVFNDVPSWILPPQKRYDSRPRVVVMLVNRGNVPEGAVVLRYAFSARLLRISGDGAQTWAIPFIVEDRRIPQTIATSATKEIAVNVNRVALDAYLKRIYRSGFWADALRVQVELEPRAGVSFQDRTLESTLPILWKATP